MNIPQVNWIFSRVSLIFCVGHGFYSFYFGSQIVCHEVVHCYFQEKYIILLIFDVNEIGLWLLYCICLLASLRAAGNTPVLKERLISFSIGIYLLFFEKLFQKSGRNALRPYRFIYV